jgi:hypothetical protein
VPVGDLVCCSRQHLGVQVAATHDDRHSRCCLSRSRRSTGRHTGAGQRPDRKSPISGSTWQGHRKRREENVSGGAQGLGWDSDRHMLHRGGDSGNLFAESALPGRLNIRFQLDPPAHAPLSPPLTQPTPNLRRAGSPAACSPLELGSPRAKSGEGIRYAGGRSAPSGLPDRRSRRETS